MAKIAEIDQDAWNEWVAGRPPVVQEMCAKLPPDRLYLLTPTGQRVTLVSYSENGTVTVAVTGGYNAVTFDRQVFGINPDDLTECDLPGEDEWLGTLLTEAADVDEFIDVIRPSVLESGMTNMVPNAPHEGPGAASSRTFPIDAVVGGDGGNDGNV